MDNSLTINEMHKEALLAQLSWQVEMGCDDALIDDTALREEWHVSLASLTQAAQVPNQQASDQQAQSQQAPHQKAQEPKSPPISPATSSTVAPSHTPNGLADISSRDALKQALHDFEGCELKRTATNMVFADGNAEAKIMIIGEAPGKDEDRMGLPFVGSAGQLLDQMLGAVGLDRTSTYIANIMPWRPPGNRALTVEEIEMMRPFVEKHISLIAPDVILSLGGTASKMMLHSSDGIMKLRGKFHSYEPKIYGVSGTPLMACLHPGYLLRAPHHKAFAFKDLVALRRKAREVGR